MEAIMTRITIRNFDERLKQRLRVRAATHGRSMEDEARDILYGTANTEPVARNLADTIRARLQSVGGVALDIPPRLSIPDAPDFDL
jgi:plasmid stability protein